MLAARPTSTNSSTEAAWRAGLPEVPGLRWCAFRRGFSEVVEGEGVEPLLGKASRLFAAAPILHAHFFDLDAQALADSAALVRLQTVDLRHNRVGPASFALRRRFDSESM